MTIKLNQRNITIGNIALRGVIELNQHIKPKIVIVGGGAGGLELATQLSKKLGNKRAEILLIDKNRTHIWKPLLHEVATGSLDPELDGVVYSAHAYKHGYQFELGELISLDPENKSITLAPRNDIRGNPLLPEREIQYDKLVLAVGSVSNDFGTPGVQENCYFMDTHAQAQQFHIELLDNFTRLNLTEEKPILNIAIVGGGATGVELSAELNHVADMIHQYGLCKINASRLSISLIEAGSRILPALSERLSNAARKQLTSLGIKVMENIRVSEATKEGYITSDDTLIKADMMVWAAGVKAPDFLKKISAFELNRANQIMVDINLKAKGQENIYVLGDCCAFVQPNGSLVPPRAQSAHQMAQCICTNIDNELKNKALKTYKYVDHGSLVNLSKFQTLGNLLGNPQSNRMFIEGKFARLMYLSLYRMHQMAIHGLSKTLGLIMAEKILKTVKPKMKLH